MSCWSRAALVPLGGCVAGAGFGGCGAAGAAVGVDAGAGCAGVCGAAVGCAAGTGGAAGRGGATDVGCAGVSGGGATGVGCGGASCGRVTGCGAWPLSIVVSPCMVACCVCRNAPCASAMARV